jgi:pyruvate dehydrogenase E1 component
MTGPKSGRAKVTARATHGHPHSADELKILNDLNAKVHWLSAWTIHNANNIRPSRDGLKVGGHQASSASLATVLSALFFSVMRPNDRIAVKPHASPAFHAIQYLFGQQSRDQLERFRALGGAQSYPSRTKDKDDVDFSTGSVGLGVAVTAFASLAQDYLLSRGWVEPERAGRMIATMGDAELDEGNIYEALIEGYKHHLRNCWWIIDYNRQSLDSVTTDRMFTRFTDFFHTTGWTVVTLKYGKLLQAAAKKPGGEDLLKWIDDCPNDLYSALTYKGGEAWRSQLRADIGHKNGVSALIADYDDHQLHELMTNLAGHDLETLLEAFHSVTSDEPHCFIVYTIKGHGLPFQGHKDNHAGLMNPSQMAEYRVKMNVPDGAEWDKFSGLPQAPQVYQAFLNQVPFASERNRRRNSAYVPVIAHDEFPLPRGKQSTQVAFGKILNDIARTRTELADAIITTSPDVTVSTNLGGWVNQRGIFSRTAKGDVFKEQNVVSPQKWVQMPHGQHLELGIAEHNLFLALAALGLSDSLFGKRLLPIGTLYDPFINRGLDALNYACYQDARFMLVATPSGLTLAPEGGAHQSIHPPLIGMAQDKLAYFEPAFVDELSEIMRWGFDWMQRPDGGSVYLRLSTRALEQPERIITESLRSDILAGAYWLRAPADGSELAIVYSGAVAPEALQAIDLISEDIPNVGLLAVTSPDVLHLDWTQAVQNRAHGVARQSHAERLLSSLAPNASLVTVIDGYPTALSWLGGVCGHRVMPLGVDHFGQSGDIDDLFEVYRLNAQAILDAAASAIVAR